MKRKYQFFYSALLITSALLIAFKFSDKEKLQIAAQMENSIQKELLNKWYPRSVDTLYGGFLSAFTYDFKPTGTQDKMIVTQARHVWSNAKAAEYYPEKKYYKESATQGFHFLRDVMWDKEYGGFYTLIDRKGNVKQTNLGIKMAYGNAFAIYGLAEYYKCSGDTGALNLAKKTFLWLEKYSHDAINKGYYQHLEKDGTVIKRTASMVSTEETGYKDQNSSIHLLEAFTELYKVWPDKLVKERLNEMLLLIRDKITTKDGYLTLFFQPDWTRVSVRDSLQETILKHHNLDYVSFGHNVETAYLMLEASEALGIKDDQQTLMIGKKMVDHALINGWDKTVGGFYDEGFYFKNNDTISILKDTKNWWAQAEGLNSLLLMSDYFPDDTMHYYQKFKTLWNYVQTYLIDHENGDWYAAGIDKEPKMKTALKGQIWKSTYHNFRALINCINRLDPDTIPPTVPAGLSLVESKNSVVIKWKPSTDNKKVLGYNIYLNDERIGFTPLAYFSINDFDKKRPAKFFVTAVDLTGSESGFSEQISYVVHSLL
jgi:mannobiose 2-epimerase